MRRKHSRTLNIVRKVTNEKTVKLTLVGPGTYQETVKNVKNEICTLQDLYMARKQKNGENETNTVGRWNMARTVTNEENET